MITRALCRKRPGTAAFRAEIFVVLTTTDHKVLSKKSDRGTIIDALSWYRNWQHHGCILTCVKQNFTRNPEKLAKVPGAREETTSHLQ